MPRRTWFPSSFTTVMQIDDPTQAALDLTVHAKGTTETQKVALK